MRSGHGGGDPAGVGAARDDPVVRDDRDAVAGGLLRSLLRHYGLSAEALAEAAGVPVDVVAACVGGERDVPVGVLIRLVEACEPGLHVAFALRVDRSDALVDARTTPEERAALAASERARLEGQVVDRVARRAFPEGFEEPTGS